MDFQTAEQQYRWLTDQYRQGKISYAKYQSSLTQIRVRDGWNREWTIQEGSGQWCVFQNGQWVYDSPPVNVVQNTAVIPEEPRKKRLGLWIGMIGLVVVCLCAGLIGGGVYFYRSGDLAWLAEQFSIDLGEGLPQLPVGVSDSEDLSLSTYQIYPLNAGESQVVDDNQAQILVPPESLSEGGYAQFIVSDPNPELEKGLSEIFTLQSRFYQLNSEAENDGTGKAQFSMPSNGLPVYLVEVFDGKYVSFSPVTETSGTINLQISLRAGINDVGNDSLAFDGSYAFAFVSPKSAYQPKNGVSLVSRRQAVDDRNCGVGMITEQHGYMAKPTYKITSICRKNPAGTVQVLFFPPDTPSVTSQQVDNVVNLVEQIMTTYQQERFIPAYLQQNGDKVRVIIQKGKGDPHYSPCNGVVYIPEDSVNNESIKYELAHELAHWIQDEAYNMTSAYWSNKLSVDSSATWWLETTAENMVMLAYPEYINQNLTVYGPPNPSDSKTPFQIAPNQWNDQLYIHAQLLKVFICENTAVCPLNMDGFRKAINQGEYPINSAQVEMMSANLGEYARYLLGKSPQQANSVINLMNAVSSGSGYGDFVAPKMEGNLSTYQKIGYAPQMELKSGDFEKEVVINAAIEKGGVYPLMLGTTTNPELIGQSAVIDIEAGTPFYYRLDDGEVLYHEGGAKLTLGPVHTALGVKKVRIVAVAKDGAKTFKAKIHPLVLNGDWIFFYESMVEDGLVCDDPDDASDMTSEEFAQFTSYLTWYPTAIMGVFNKDQGGNSYSWVSTPGSSLDTGDIEIQISGSGLVEAKQVTVEAAVHIPNAETSQLNPNLPVVFASSIGLVVLLFLRKKKSLSVINLTLIAVLISACSAAFGFYGDLNSKVVIDQFTPTQGKSLSELLGADSAESVEAGGDMQPLYMVKGTATSTPNFIMKVYLFSVEGEQSSAVVCSGTLRYRVTGFFFEDGIVTQIPSAGEE